MEIKREPLGTGSSGEFRARQLRARDMLRGELEDDELEKHVEQSVLTTTIDKAARLGDRQRDLPATFGLACCAIEMMSLVGARVDIARFGFEAVRAPARARPTLIILSGRVSIKMAPVVRRLYDQMLEPQLGDRDGRVLLVDGRVQQLRDRARPTSSCRSTCTSPAARHAPRRSSTGSSSCAR